MKKENYLPHIREHYEELPYPPYEPAEEYERLNGAWMQQLARINHYGYQGKRRFDQEPFRVLSAGGGTGHGVIYLAEQLRGMPAELVYVDMSEASMAIAKKRAEIRQLDNITFHHGSILDVAEMDLGTFDYIECSGVLHHLENPNAGLQALANVLKNDGIMTIMVYAAIGRTAIYHMQDLMRLINAGVEDKAARLTWLKSVNRFLPKSNWLQLFRTVYRSRDDFGENGDAGLYDLYLHEQDRAYTIPQLYDWLAGAGLEMVGTPGDGGQQMMYLPQSYLQDAELLGHIQKLPQAKQYAIGELISGAITKHTFYAAKPGKQPASTTDGDLIPTFNPNCMAPSLQKDFVAALAAGRAVNFPRQGLSPNIRPDAVMKALFTHMDNKITLKQLNNRIAMQLQQEGIVLEQAELVGRVGNILHQFVLLEFIYLRAPNVPIYAGEAALQKRFLEEILRGKNS